ncbi:peptide chain release factor N(5)-glutamine methyltransferase [Tepidibacillus marianensis]|uniref:peptide chain release factor N(5)-glutamine methyltransferase n=1 Tax=Tepidibacillus marianensis TaxID=3131995 RepID=UPI0030CABD0E
MGFFLLTKQQIEHAQLEAEMMIRSLYGWDRNQLFLHWYESVSDEKLEQLGQWLNRRSKYEPLQYIVGTQEFYGREFEVNPSVLIPRPETELLIEEVLQQAQQTWQDQALTVVDIGTGSGAIAITLALEMPNWQVHTVDISEEALATAKGNAKRLGADVNFHLGNLLEPLLENDQKVDLIISNPPYIPSQDVLELMPNVRDYEPKLALDGGIDGLDFYRKIMFQSQKILNRPGMIAFEIGIHQSEVIQQLFKESGALSYEVKPDFQGIPRVAKAKY